MIMFIDFLIVCVIGFFIGWHTSKAWQIIAFKKLLEDLGITNVQLNDLAKKLDMDVLDEKPEQESDLPILEVRVEKTDLGLFAYRKADSLYLARGQDREELMANLVNNLSNVRVIVAKEDGAEFIDPGPQRT